MATAPAAVWSACIYDGEWKVYYVGVVLVPLQPTVEDGPLDRSAVVPAELVMALYRQQRYLSPSWPTCRWKYSWFSHRDDLAGSWSACREAGIGPRRRT